MGQRGHLPSPGSAGGTCFSAVSTSFIARMEIVSSVQVDPEPPGGEFDGPTVTGQARGRVVNSMGHGKTT